MFFIFALITTTLSSTHRIEGYYENWKTVDWWQNKIPGNCQMGCAKPKEFLQLLKPFTTAIYGFTFLTTSPNPKQVNCGNCPEWNGKSINVASGGRGRLVVTGQDTKWDNSGVVGISEVCRLSRMGFDTPKRCRIALGGWSDWARLNSPDKARALAKLVGEMVLKTFADGIDLDFEHLTPFNRMGDEYDSFVTLIQEIRKVFENEVKQKWVAEAQARIPILQAAYSKLPNWQKPSPYYPTNIEYMRNLVKNGPPEHLVISWTTRFNAFLNPQKPYNYLMPDSPIPNVPFETDNEGTKFYDKVRDDVDVVNIMAYDAGCDTGALKLNFSQILENFHQFGGVEKSKMNIGFEPGSEAGGGVWEGFEADINAGKFVASENYGGTMIWALNKVDAQNEVNELTEKLNEILDVGYPYDKVPKFSRVNEDGWMSNVLISDL